MNKTKGGILIPDYIAPTLAGVAGTTRLTDAFIPDLFGTYATEDTAELTAFADSGILRTSPLINNMVQNGGSTITLPYWNDLDADDEPNYSNDDPADLSTPDKIDSGEQTARVAFLNNSWAAADLVTELAGSSPNQRIASRIDNYWARQWQRRAIAVAVGLFNDNVAANSSDMVVDATAYTDVGEQIFNVNNFVDAAFTMGDRVGGLNVVVMHSMVAKRVTKNNEVEEIRDSEGNLLYTAYKGARIILDDGMPTFGSGPTRSYLSIMFGPGALTYGYGNPRVPAETERKPDGGHGGGVEVLYSRKTWLIHPTGYKFLATTLTGNGATDDGVAVKNASWADLRLATNWERQLERKKINMAFLLTRG